jgi:hypothetical protein
MQLLALPHWQMTGNAIGFGVERFQRSGRYPRSGQSPMVCSEPILLGLYPAGIFFAQADRMNAPGANAGGSSRPVLTGNVV